MCNPTQHLDKGSVIRIQTCFLMFFLQIEYPLQKGNHLGDVFVHRRLSYTGPGITKNHCFPPKNENAELGTLFKASHAKSLLWWLALRANQVSRDNPEELFSQCLEPESFLGEFLPKFIFP